MILISLEALRSFGPSGFSVGDPGRTTACHPRRPELCSTSIFTSKFSGCLIPGRSRTTALPMKIPDGPKSRDRAMTSPAARIFLLSSVALFLELTLIRWIPSVVPAVAYFGNLLLVSSFLGLGLGSLNSRRFGRLVDWFPPLLLAAVALLMLAGNFAFPANDAELRFGATASGWLAYGSLVAVFLFNTAVFVPLAARAWRRVS